MRLLHVTPAFQHPQVRGPHRHYHFLRELAAHHEVTLLTLLRSEVPAAAWAEVVGLTRHVEAVDVTPTAARGLATHLPRVPGAGRRLAERARVRQGVHQLRRRFRELAAAGDVDGVLFHGKSVFPVIRGATAGLPVVIDFCDATSMRLAGRARAARGPRRWLLWLRHGHMRRLENALLATSPHVAFISPRDRAAVLGPDATAPVVPNGVDLAYWTRRAPAPAAGQDLVFTGVLDYGPNEDAAGFLVDEIVPRLRERGWAGEVWVVGRDPSARLQEQARRQPGVAVTGFVPDMRPYLERAAVFVAPMRHASGTQNKVLEAMAMGLPVLTTPVVAAGLVLDATPPPVWVADGATDFADSLLCLLGAGAERAELAEAGRAYVAARFSWPHSAQLLEQMLLSARADLATARAAGPRKGGDRG